jgi:MoxR-like ATPase
MALQVTGYLAKLYGNLEGSTSPPERIAMQSSAHSHMSMQDASNALRNLRDQLRGRVFGQESLIDELVCCLAANGHLLMTGAPGVAKTTLIRTLAGLVQLQFKRIQFTPDLLPSDITGAEILNIDPATGAREFRFVKGPVFGGLVLADEINRASPRTQSALLEAMQERRVTVAGKTHELPWPFLVFATQNPFESEGVFPLPEAQLDRFLLHSLVDYPGAAAELTMLDEHAAGTLVGENPQSAPEVAFDAATCAGIVDTAKRIAIDEALLKGIVALVRMTRPGTAGRGQEEAPDFVNGAVVYGAGPRCGLALVSAARGLALMEGTEAVQWRHVERLAKPVLRHRLRLNMAAVRDGLTEDAIIDRLLVHCREKLRLETLHS